MPRDNTILYGRAYRQFCPLTLYTTFDEEMLLTCPPLTLFRVFDIKVAASRRADRGSTPTSGPSAIPKPSSTPIPKPPGEVARPKRGGYNLEQAIQLPSKEDYDSIRITAKKIATEVLDSTKRFLSQHIDVKNQAVAMLESAHPVLEAYQDHWAAMDFLKMCQDNIASRTKGVDTPGIYALGGRVQLKPVANPDRKGKQRATRSSSSTSA